MVEKYIDLEERIKRDRDLSLTGLDRITYTLRWLDRNPDQVPGRTITEGEMEHKRATYGAAYETGFKQAGGRIAPDPKPTNAAKLAEQISVAWGPREWHDGYDDHIKRIAERLDEQGVKAPGGDDD